MAEERSFVGFLWSEKTYTCDNKKILTVKEKGVPNYEEDGVITYRLESSQKASAMIS